MMGKKQLTKLDNGISAGFIKPSAVLQSEQKVEIKTVLDQLPVAIIVVNKEGKPINYNYEAVNILGEISADIDPQQWLKCFSRSTVGQQQNTVDETLPILRALKGETVAAEDLNYSNGDPSAAKWISMSAKPYKADNGEIIGATVLLNDITYRKESEISSQHKIQLAQLAYTLQQKITNLRNDPRKILEEVVKFGAENIGDGCIAALLNQPADKLRVITIKHIKPAANALLYKAIVSKEFGLQSAIQSVIITGKPLLIPAVDQSRLKRITAPDQLQYLQEFGLQSMVAVPIKGRNHIIGTLTLIRDRGGDPFTNEDLNYLTDISTRTGQAIDNSMLENLLVKESSGRKTAEKALEQSEIRFQSVFTSTALGIKILDLEGNIIETNPAFQNMLGYSEEELQGKPLSDLWHKGDVNQLLTLLRKLKNENVPSIQLEHRLMGKDNSVIWMNVSITRIKKNDQDDSFPFIVAIAENITERKHIEAEMARLKSRLQGHVELERLRLAQDLHDGPLQDLYSTVYKLENWGGLTGNEQVEKIDTIKQDLLDVINILRRTAKDLRPPTLAEYGLEKAIRSHIEDFCEISPDIKVTLNLAQDGQILPEDIRLILFRIYQHLMTNVLRHSQASQVFIDFHFDAENAYLEMRDDGIGFDVPANWMDLVRAGHFGLAGAVERVTLLDGKFLVESSPGRGTVIRVVLPLPQNTELDEEIED